MKRKLLCAFILSLICIVFAVGASADDISAHLSRLNSYNSVEEAPLFLEEIESVKTLFGTDTTAYYDSFSNTEKERLSYIMIQIRSDNGYESVADFNEDFATAEYLIALDNLTAEDDVYAFLETDAANTALKFDARYMQATDMVKRQVAMVVASEDFELPMDLNKLILEKLVVAEFNAIGVWNELEYLVNKYSDIIVIAPSIKVKLNSIGKEDVYQMMYQRVQSAGLQTIDNIIVTYETSIMEVYEISRPAKPNYGGGGGGGGSASTPQKYTITDIRLTDLKGNAIDYDGGSCMVNVTVTKNTNVDDGYVVISTYTEDETLIGFNYLFTSLEEGKSATLGAMVSLPDTEKIGKVKVMVWDSLDGMTPLAASKTLVPGEEFEPDPTPTPEPTPTPIPNNIIINNNRVLSCDSMSITAYDDSGRIKTYRFSAAMDVYINGHRCSEFILSTIVSASDSDIILSDIDYDNIYDRIDVDVFITAMVSAKTASTITLSGITGVIGNPVNPSFDITDVSRITVMRNGLDATLDDIEIDDVVSLKYNMSYELNDAPFVSVYASNKTVTGVYNGYDNENNLYTISGIVYPSVKTMPITLGTEYTFALDYFGKLYSAEENMFAVNFAIVERFADITDAQNYGAEYAYIDVVTMYGESKRLFIDTSYAVIADTIFTSAGIGFSRSSNACLGIAPRIIEYKVKASTGRVNSLAISYNVDTFCCTRYNPITNRLSKPLVENAVVLDATKYDPTMPSASDYKASSLDKLKEGVDYDGVLIGKSGSNKWHYVIIEVGGATYNIGDDFAVAAENASTSNRTIIDDEEVFQLSVIEKGNSSATKINISSVAEIWVNNMCYPYYECYNYLRKGAAFYYTVDEYGLVDRIDVVLQGGYDYDTLKSLITEEYGSTSATINSFIFPPSASEIKPVTWFVDIDKWDNTAMDEQIQLFIAPVLYTGSDFVSFGAVEGNATDGLYVNTNADYTFSIADDAKIYSYDMSGNYYGKYAFMSGAFRGFDIADASADGRAWLTNVPASECNFDGLVQFAFVMAVDGEITNALLFNA